MTSIFIWEADTKPPTGCSMVRYDRGADWFLEESGESYQLIQQKKTDSYLYYQAKRMPTDWVGTHWLESVVIPYSIWKTEGDVRWDQLGIWNRWIGPDTSIPMEEQWEAVQRWCRGEGPFALSVPLSVPLSASLSVPPSASLTPSFGMDREKRRGRSQGRGIILPPHSSHQEYIQDLYQDRGQGRGQGGSRGRGGGRGRGRGRGQERGGRGNIRI